MMPIEWTGLGPDLPLVLDRAAAEPLGRQLEGALRDAIRIGRLAAGERLPSSRILAAELGISRGLALAAYRQLQAEGYLTTKLGSATRVAAGAQVVAARPSLESRPRPPAIDFAPGIPDLTSFPRREWAAALRESTQQISVGDLAYDDARGVSRLREVLAAYLRRVRGVVADPERVVIVAGFAQGLNLVLGALKEAGVGVVALEDPGDLRYLTSVVERAGLKTAPVRVDEHGLDVTALRRTSARAVVVTPAHQSPTGVVLAPERRHELIAWAAECDGFVIEDDYDAEFRYDRSPVGSLQGLDPDRVFNIGTVSKSLAPALRLGWIVSPQTFVRALITEKQLADRGSPALDQLALAMLVESGRYDRHLRRMRGIYGRRRDLLVRLLADLAPSVEVSGLAAGFHLVARLSDSLDETRIVAEARRRDVGLYGISKFRSDRALVPTAIVVGFGNVAEPAVERGIGLIADLLVP
jgi:GntR family transcriptional regulator / MocR family aminotransferase